MWEMLSTGKYLTIFVKLWIESVLTSVHHKNVVCEHNVVTNAKSNISSCTRDVLSLET